MSVWIVEWKQPGQNEMNVTLWDTKDHALQSACADIMDSISGWDLNDPDTLDAAEEINNYVHNCNYLSAMNSYNDYQSNSNDYEYTDYYSVYMRPVGTSPQVPSLICFDPPDDEEVEEEVVPVVKSIECPCGLFRADCDYHK